MDKPNIVVTFHPIHGQQAFLHELLGKIASLTFLTELEAGQRERVLEEATILLSWNFPREIQPQDYASLRRVLFIQLLSAGADHMPIASLSPRIIVASNPGAYAVPMAEHVMAMTLALAKHLLVQQQKLKEGEFDQFTSNRLLSGMMAGILGYGGIGRATARLMRAFGMRIYVINTSGISPEPADFVGTLSDLERVLRESDVVVLSLPLTRTTRVLPWDMVDNSSNSPRTHFKLVFRHWTVQTGHLFPRRGSIRVLLLAPSPTPSQHDTPPTSGLSGSQAGTGGNGQESTSRAVHRRVVLPAAMAGVRCR